MVAGTGRLLELLPQFRFDNDACELLARFLDTQTLDYLRDFRFCGDIDGYAEGELYFPGSPVLSLHGSFAECVLLETVVLSIFNHDTAIASAAARMVSAAGDRPLIEMAHAGRMSAPPSPPPGPRTSRAFRARPTWKPSGDTGYRPKAPPPTRSPCFTPAGTAHRKWPS
ncbi:nicotinate phosphoribosyltransferase pncB1 domain protein [Mycobacterium kansasii]|uniref:Nicotinate phosphoribosyltransferase pncB1 domain protein n=1 Tax=Mycobacterium kansasii TaxID=1768 RepID=A0A1V3XIM2_MYCKA|nr:nicotinate phosphoribosyltransferase pncB1 domain protein [Mycobacterium kansasii]